VFGSWLTQTFFLLKPSYFLLNENPLGLKHPEVIGIFKPDGHSFLVHLLIVLQQFMPGFCPLAREARLTTFFQVNFIASRAALETPVSTAAKSDWCSCIRQRIMTVAKIKRLASAGKPLVSSDSTTLNHVSSVIYCTPNT
jgi:hypothetical protein